MRTDTEMACFEAVFFELMSRVSLALLRIENKASDRKKLLKQSRKDDRMLITETVQRTKTKVSVRLILPLSKVVWGDFWPYPSMEENSYPVDARVIRIACTQR